MKSSLIILLFICTLSKAQTKIQGYVKNSDSIPINSATIVLEDPNNHIIAYAITNSKGYFVISQKLKFKQYLIYIKSLGFIGVKENILIKNGLKDVNINFTLETNITKLDEVIIRAKKRPFTIKKDTVKYNVNSYLDGSERKIQDLIKKMPGIEVNTSTGEIKYKGKSVETVLLEGDNLFGYNYSLGTKKIN